MEYDPAVSIHKASSITSTTSTNSSTSTWDHPIMPGSSNLLRHLNKPDVEEEVLADYNQFIADRISLSTTPASFVEYHTTMATEEKLRNIDYRHQQSRKKNFSSYTDTFMSHNEEEETEDERSPVIPNLTSTANIKKNNYHENTSSSPKQQQQSTSKNNHAVLQQQQQQQDYPVPIYLQHGDQITVPSSATTSLVYNMNRKKNLPSSGSQDDYQSQISSYTSSSASGRPILPSPTAAPHHEQRERSNSVSSISSANKRSKLNNRDILTDDEKRVNHIASEQKRRNTIRMGFKDLTDIIPTLKNVNNSKSTILFKAVEYMKHLDKRNRNLKEKVSSLQVRMTVEGRLIEQQQRYRNNSLKYNKIFGKQQQQRQLPVQQSLLPQQQQQQTAKEEHSPEFGHLPAQTVSALMAHKNQQRQLEQLQEQLRAQHQLLQKHNILPPPDHHTTYKSSSLPELYPNRNSSNSSDTTYPAIKLSTATTSLERNEQQRQYNSISIPSSRSSNSDENEIASAATALHNHSSLIMPQDLEGQHEHHPGYFHQ